MIIHALDHLYQRLSQDVNSGIAPRGFSSEKIDFCLVIDLQGRLVAIDDLRVPTAKGNKFLSRVMLVPKAEKRTVGIKSNFAWDKTAYVLGVSLTSKRLAQEHQAFKDRQYEVLDSIKDEPVVDSFLMFIEKWQPNMIDEPIFESYREALIDSNVVFRLDGEDYYFHQNPTVQQQWLALQSSSSDEDDTANQNKASYTAQCLIRGEKLPIARLHPAIKGVDNAQSSGASIVTFNLDAFESYGKTQGFNAPISQEVAFNYTTALNHLLRKDSSNFQRLKIGDATVVFWAQAGNDQSANEAESMLAMMLQPDDEAEAKKIEPILLDVAQGRPIEQVAPNISADTRIFILGLAPNASRLSIRFWYSDTFAEITKHLAIHYQDLYIEPVPWRKLPSVDYLALQTAPIRQGKAKYDDIAPLVAGNLMRAVLTGQRYPKSLLVQLLMRMRSDGEVNGMRVAMIKAILNRQTRLTPTNHSIQPTHQEITMSLDIHETNPAYLLGRLFAVLESIQREALGTQVGATVRDRYWASASATPASIFPTIQRNAINHLSKIRKDKPKLAGFFDRQIGQILDSLTTQFPASFNLDEQGRFTIGYYHQRFTKHIKSADGQVEENLMATTAQDVKTSDDD